MIQHDKLRKKGYLLLRLSEYSTDLSIIIPVYNTWDLCTKVLDRIFSYGFLHSERDWLEIIVVNDASSDDLILDSSRKRNLYGKVQIINLKTNVGAAIARNIGVMKSTSRFIWFVDSDDDVGKSFRASLDLFRRDIKKDIDLFILNYMVIDQGGHNYNRDFIAQINCKGVNYFHESLDANNIICSQFRSVVWRYIIRREFLLLNHIVFNDVRLFEDVAYICKLMISRPKAIVLSGKPYLHLRRPCSLSNYLVPNNLDSYYFDNIVAFLSILDNLYYELESNNNQFIVSFLKLKLSTIMCHMLFLLPFISITKLHNEKWKEIILKEKIYGADILRNFNMTIEDNMFANYYNYNNLVMSRIYSIEKHLSIGIYCVSMFSVGCAKLMIGAGYNVRCFFDKEHSSDVVINDMKFKVNNIDKGNMNSQKLDCIVVINRSKDICFEILNDIKGKSITIEGLFTIYME